MTTTGSGEGEAMSDVDRYDLQGVQAWPTMFFTRRWREFDADQADIIAVLRELQSRQPRAVDSDVAIGAKPASGLYESDFDLLAKPHEKLTNLRRFIESSLALAASVANGREVPPDDLVVSIVESWYHITNDGGFHDAHHHHACSWCGIFYVQIAASGRTAAGGAPNGGSRFYSPLATGGLYRDYGNKYLVETMDAPLEDGLLLLFPSYLLHSGLPYRGDVDRILIAFNAQVHVREGSPSATRLTGRR
jgi:uncharacterized protein (TIGR02466 family)